MKLLIEILLSVFLHPIAVILVWLHIFGRSDLGFMRKVLWLIVSTVWGLGPILYIFLGDGALW